MKLCCVVTDIGMPHFYILKCAKHIIILAKHPTISHLISNPEELHLWKSYWNKHKKESCMKIEQYWIKIKFLLKHHASIMKSRGGITHTGRFNWICYLMVLYWICGIFILVDLVYWCLLLMSFFDMSLCYGGRGWLWLLVLYLATHLICTVTFR